MKQAQTVEALVLMLVVSGCTPEAVPGPSPGATPKSRDTAPPGPSSPSDQPPPAPTGANAPEATLSESEREALSASSRSLIEKFVDAFSRGDIAVAETMFVSDSAFESIVTPGFRSILGAGLLARNKQELANLVEALKGHTVESWKWKPGKLARTAGESAFARSLVQISGGTIELQVDGTFMAVSIDQMVQIDGAWAIFQLHNL